MKNYQFLLCVAITALTCIVGCSADTADHKSAVDKPKSGEHVHADGTVHNSHAEEGHSHGEGPHGGTIADWGGGKFHVEFTVDHEKQEATVYILGTDEKTAKAIDSDEIILAIKDPEFSVALKPSPEAGDSDGEASRFIGKHESLGVVKDYEGSMSAVINGTPYSGSFKETAHEH